MQFKDNLLLGSALGAAREFRDSGSNPALQEDFPVGFSTLQSVTLAFTTLSLFLLTASCSPLYH